jgi:nucleotide-binding universal stress UspA family protein
MYRKILLPLDGSSLAEKALPHAVAIAGCCQAELIMLRVLEPLSESLGKTSKAVKVAEEKTRELASAYLERVADSVRKDGLSARVEVIEGRPHYRTVEFAQTNHVDLIVICARGRSGISRWLMGSVGDRVIRGADVPVLMVRPAKPTQSRAET